MKTNSQKHNAGYPTARKIRRACSNELYRTVKRMKLWISKDMMDQAEAIYFKKVILNLTWVIENESNRKAQADWWDENVGPEIAELWKVDREKLCSAFREAFGG
ncbi:toxin CptA [Paenibacillus castaneae]|uniref:dehydrogenase n=1 Tax=Paenibacillus castaneae TaxID=474957 RepID=UPI000C9B412B|nr:dehydrogenase [Paenibacillus castaneae]NIK78373.1 toxin CptA [Paenibacillus castaneae]